MIFSSRIWFPRTLKKINSDAKLRTKNPGFSKLSLRAIRLSLQPRSQLFFPFFSRAIFFRISSRHQKVNYIIYYFIFWSTPPLDRAVALSTITVDVLVSQISVQRTNVGWLEKKSSNPTNNIEFTLNQTERTILGLWMVKDETSDAIHWKANYFVTDCTIGIRNSFDKWN